MTIGNTPAVSATPPPFPNPYVGPRYFERTESRFFFGRDEEIEILTGLVVAHQLSLFFAQSGAGKSSLLRAGLIPRLTSKRRVGLGDQARLYQTMHVLPIVTVGGALLPNDTTAIDNFYSYNVQRSLLPSADVGDLAILQLRDALEILLDDGIAGGAIWEPQRESVDGRVRPPLIKPDTTLLIFDQFEEIFTVDPERRQEREAFFRQLNDLLLDFPTLHILLTMREDYLAELTPYANLLVNDLRHDFRMERLQQAGALQAVTQPAAAAGRTFAPDVAETLVNNLRRVQRSQRAALHLAATPPTVGDQPQPVPPVSYGDYVEPVHLQIVCRDLWSKLPDTQTEIQAADLDNFGDVDQALTNFYEHALARVVAETNVSERTLRHWFDEELITPARTKGLVYRDEEAGTTEGLPNQAVDILRDAYIIRADVRGGDVWYELAHDRLVEPILAANRRWSAAYDNPVAAAYAQWVTERNPQKLLRNGVLHVAERYAQGHPNELTLEELEYLRESRRQWDAVQREAQRRRWRLIGGAVSAVVIISLLVATFWQVNYNRRVSADATRQDQIARSRQSAIRSANALAADDMEQALWFSVQAGKIYTTVEAFSAIRDALVSPVSIIQRFDHGAGIEAIAWDGQQQVVSVGDKIVRWNLTEGLYVGEWALPPELENALSVTWNGDGTQLATGHQSGQLVIWSLDGQGVARNAHAGDVATVAWHPVQNFVLTGGADGMVRIWDPARMEPVTEIEIGTPVNQARWDTTGNRILIGGQDGSVRAWDMEEEQPQFVMNVYSLIGTTDVQWRTNSEQFLTAGVLGFGNDGLLSAAHLWQSGTEQQIPIVTFGGHRGAIWRVIFNPAGTRVATAGEDTEIRIWDADTGLLQDILRGHIGVVRSLRWLSETHLISAGDDGQILVWSFERSGELPFRDEYGARVSVLQWLEDDLILSAAHDGRGDLWRASDGEIVMTIHHADNAPIYGARVHPDGSQLLTTSADGTVGVWNLDTLQPITRLGPASGSYIYARWNWWDQSLVMAGYTCIRAAACPERNRFEIHIWQAAKILRGSSPEPDLVLIGHTDSIQTARWNPTDWVAPQGTRMATAGHDGTIRIWDVAIDSPTAGETLQTLFHAVTMTSTTTLTSTTQTFGSDPARWINEAKWNEAGSVLLSYSNDHTARIWQWDNQTEQFIGALSPLHHAGPVTWADWFNEDQQVVTVSEDGLGRIWDAQSGQLLYELNGHTAAIGGAYWTSEAKAQLLTVSDDATAILWQISNGILLRRFVGHGDQVSGARIDETEDLLITYSKDNTARLWRLSTSEPLAVLTGHTDDVVFVDWNSDRTRFVTGGMDGVVRQYYREMDELLRAACQRVVRTTTVPATAESSLLDSGDDTVDSFCAALN